MRFRERGRNERDKRKESEPFCYSMPLTDTYIKLNEMEVVGNVFDNPELLEEENVHGRCDQNH